MKSKKIMALLLSAMMVTTAFTGCGSTKSESTESEAESSAVTTGSATDTVATSEVSQESEEPVKLKIMLHNVTEIPEGSIADQWSTQLEEKLNLEIEWILPPASAYEDNLQLTLINDEKPDVICFPTDWLNQTSFKDACESGMFYDLSDMLGNYENIMAHTDEVSWEALDIFNDGSIWGMPRSSPARADGLWLREDWLKNLNIDYTEGEFLTLDEFYDLMYAFTYDDPDGNGINDTYGLQVYSNADGSLFEGVSRIFHIGTGWYEMEDGTVTNLKYSKDYDYYEQYLAFMNKCWEAGLIEPDAFAINATVSKERVEQYGIQPGYPGNMTVVAAEGSTRTHLYCPGVVVDGDPIGTYSYGDSSTGIWYYYAVSSTCEHPEKFLELCDYVLSDEQWVNLNAQNLIDVGFTMDEAGNYDFSLRDAIKAADKENGTNLRNAKLISMFLRRSDGVEFFVDKALPVDQQKRIANLIDVTFDLYWPTLDRGYKPEIATDPVFIEYRSYMIQEEAKIITGDKPVEYWDELLEGFYEAGYDKYVEQMTAYIDTIK